MSSSYTPSTRVKSSRKRARTASQPPAQSESSQSQEQLPSQSQGQSSQSGERVSKRAKYQALIYVMKANRWSTRELLQFWLEDNDIKLDHQYLRTSQLRQQAFNEALAGREAQYSQRLVQQVRQEFNQLAKCQYFNKFNPEPSFSDINFEDAVKQIERRAPIWHSFITQVLQNQRAHRDSAPDDSKKNIKRQFTITAMICHSQRIQTSNFLMTTLSMYLGSSGVKRRVIDTLAGLGICYGYGTTLGLINQLAIKASVSVVLE